MPSRHGYGLSDRHDAMAIMQQRHAQGHNARSTVDGERRDFASQQAFGSSMRRSLSRSKQVEQDARAVLQPPTPRGGGRGPAEARLARSGIDTMECSLPAGVEGADFKTLQAMISTGIQKSEEDFVLLENSLSGGEWGIVQDAEEEAWRRKQRQTCEAEAATREKDRARAREQRQREDEERRRRQIEELEKELLEDKCREQQLLAEQEQKESTCRRETEAATKIQARYRGQQSRATQMR